MQDFKNSVHRGQAISFSNGFLEFISLALSRWDTKLMLQITDNSVSPKKYMKD